MQFGLDPDGESSAAASSGDEAPAHRLPVVSVSTVHRPDSGTLTNASAPRFWRRTSVPRWTASGSAYGQPVGIPVEAPSADREDAPEGLW